MVTAALFLATIAALSRFGHHVLDGARAQTAADSAALGGLTGGRTAASQLAASHGAALVEFRSVAGTRVVTVVVRVGDRTAAASASDAVAVP